jgi:hypothetical protein
MNIALWIAQILLAFAFLGAAYVHAVRWEHTSAEPRMAWLADIGHQRAIGTGLLDAAGGVGMIAPSVTGILPWLTPLAAFVAYGLFVLLPL